MKRIFKKLLFLITGNKYFQRKLQIVFKSVIILMGIGTGAHPSQSGEIGVLKFLTKKSQSSNSKLVIFDVGTNKGQFLDLIISNFVSNKYIVYCFEPASSVYSELIEKYQSKKNVVIENLGFDCLTGSSNLYYDFPGSLRTSKYKRNLRHLNIDFPYSEFAEFTTLDDYCRSKRIEKIDLLKLDVEGNEFNILKGAKHLLKNRRIQLITFEFGRAQIDSKTFFKEIYYFLESYHLKKLFRILPNGYLYPVNKYDESCEIFFTTNYLAVMWRIIQHVPNQKEYQ